MPFSTTRVIPREVKEMPAGAKKVWMAAFRQALKEEPEDMAGHLAMNAVKKLFSRIENEEGEEEWVSKEKANEEREAQIAEEVRVAKGGDPDDPEDDPDQGGGKEERKGARAVEKDPEFEKATNVIKAARAVSVAAGAGATATGDSDVQLTEMLVLDSKGFRLTGDGFLVTEPRVARTGIQIYKGWEVGHPEMEDVRVYRPESEVFDKAAMTSLAHRTITLNHPDEKVDATNWKELSVGHSSGTVTRDGDFIRVPLVLMDAHAIQAAQSGVSQLSVGYGAKLKWADGVTPDGQTYDAIQTEIRANHIALVQSARGGDKLRIGDTKGNHGQQRRKPMTERTLVIDGVTITLEDKDSQILERHLAAVTQRLKDQEEEIDELEKKTGEIESDLEEAKKDSETKDGTIAALTQKLGDSKLTPDKLDKAIALRMDVVDRATAFFGDAAKYAWVGKSDAQIRRDVVTARMGEQKTKDMNDSMIEGAFLSLTEPETQDGFQRMTQSFSRAPVNNGNLNDAAAKAYDKRNEELSNRYKRNRQPFVSA